MGITMNALITHLALKIVPGFTDNIQLGISVNCQGCAWEIDNRFPLFIVPQFGHLCCSISQRPYMLYGFFPILWPMKHCLTALSKGSLTGLEMNRESVGTFTNWKDKIKSDFPFCQVLLLRIRFINKTRDSKAGSQ